MTGLAPKLHLPPEVLLGSIEVAPQHRQPTQSPVRPRLTASDRSGPARSGAASATAPWPARVDRAAATPPPGWTGAGLARPILPPGPRRGPRPLLEPSSGLLQVAS